MSTERGPWTKNAAREYVDVWNRCGYSCRMPEYNRPMPPMPPDAPPREVPEHLEGALASLTDKWRNVSRWGEMTQLDELCEMGLAECRVTRRFGGDTGTDSFYRRAQRSPTQPTEQQ